MESSSSDDDENYLSIPLLKVIKNLETRAQFEDDDNIQNISVQKSTLENTQTEQLKSDEIIDGKNSIIYFLVLKSFYKCLNFIPDFTDDNVDFKADVAILKKFNNTINQEIEKFYYKSDFLSERVLKNISKDVLTNVDVNICCQKGSLTINDIKDMCYFIIERTSNNSSVNSSLSDLIDEVFKVDTKAPPVNFSKEYINEMLQKVFKIDTYEHQMIYNIGQLGNEDKQSNCLQEELKDWKTMLKNPELLKKVINDIEDEEALNENVNFLIRHIRNFETKLNQIEQKSANARKGQGTIVENERFPESVENELKFKVKVRIAEADRIQQYGNKLIFFALEINGYEKFQTEAVEAKIAKWSSCAEWNIKIPLPIIKLKILQNVSGVLGMDAKEISKSNICIFVGISGSYHWYDMGSVKQPIADRPRIKVSLMMDKPSIIKKSGFLYIIDYKRWLKWKKSFTLLIQDQDNIYLATFLENSQKPEAYILFNGYTVDYSIKNQELKGGKNFFVAIKEGSTITMAVDDDNEASAWVNILCQLTNQKYKPVKRDLVNQNVSVNSNDQKNHTISEIISTKVTHYNHTEFLSIFERLMMEFQTKDILFSPNLLNFPQEFLIDSYCQRYFISQSNKQLAKLENYLYVCDIGYNLDPSLMIIPYGSCQQMVSQMRLNERSKFSENFVQRFDDCSFKLRTFLLDKLSNYKCYCPYRRPKGYLQKIIKSLNKIFEEDVEEINEKISMCLRHAALRAYEESSIRVNVEAFTDSNYDLEVKTSNFCKLMENMLFKALNMQFIITDNQVIELKIVKEHLNSLLSLSLVDLDDIQMTSTDFNNYNRKNEVFNIFTIINTFLKKNELVYMENFHREICNRFGVIIKEFQNKMIFDFQNILTKDYDLKKRTFTRNVASIIEEAVQRADETLIFYDKLEWPDPEFNKMFEYKTSYDISMCFEDFTYKIIDCFEKELNIFNPYNNIKTSENLIYYIQCNFIVKNLLEDFCGCLLRENEHSSTLDNQEPKQSFFYKIEKQISNMINQFIKKMLSRIEDFLSKLSMLDGPKFLTTIMSFMVNETHGERIALWVIEFLDAIQDNINHTELLLQIITIFFNETNVLLRQFVDERSDVPLHKEQTMALYHYTTATLDKLLFCGLPIEYKNSNDYTAIKDRIHMEMTLLNIQIDNQEYENEDNIGISEQIPLQQVNSEEEQKIFEQQSVNNEEYPENYGIYSDE